LPTAPQARIDFTVLVEIGCIGPRAVASVQVEDPAFTDVDEEADVLTASVEAKLLAHKGWKGAEQDIYFFKCWLQPPKPSLSQQTA